MDVVAKPWPPAGLGLSVIFPAFNEAGNVGALLTRLGPVLDRIGLDAEIIAIDDRSTDGTFAELLALRAAEPRLKVLRFSRNFGKEIALAAGLRHARGAAVVMMDADLQHPPELIESFVAQWREGADIVYGQRNRGREDGPIRRLLTRAFYGVFDRIADVRLMRDGGDFALFDAKVVSTLNAMPERNRFGKGLYARVGFRRVAVPFRPDIRRHGVSSWSFWRLWALAVDALTSFSVVPLRIWSYVGLVISLAAFAYGAVILTETMAHGTDVPGYPSLMVAVAFFGGIQLITLGVLGEYLGQVFMEVKRRPLYVIDEAVGFDEDAADAAQQRTLKKVREP